MELEKLLSEINELKKEADSYKPLNNEQNQRFLQKIRLDWNYHSNHIEGNQLTYGETKNLLLWGITARGKPLKDHLEISGHDEAIDWLFDQIKNSEQRGISQHFIRELHQLILKQNYQAPAITPTGEKITRTIQAGQYKTTPNHVLTVTGKTFYFATPEETPAKMTDLVDWFRDQFEKKEEHPLIIAALFHYKFVRIHPFDDGNGRMARLLMNFILMMYDFPPLIIPTEERETYLKTLALSDEQEDIKEFVFYLGTRLLASLELYIKAAKGESIEEPDDLDKTINLLKRKFPPKVPKTPERIKQIILEYIIPLFNYDSIFTKEEMEEMATNIAKGVLIEIEKQIPK